MAVAKSHHYICTCEKCGYAWQARVKIPKACPACKSVKWNKPKKEVENA